jgi:hypothetical protein
MEPSNDVCLRSECYQAQETQAIFGASSLFNFCSEPFTVGYMLKIAKRERSYIFKATSILVVRSCQEPRTCPESSYDRYLDRRRPPMCRIALGGFIYLPGFTMPSHKMPGQDEMDPTAVDLHWKR